MEHNPFTSLINEFKKELHNVKGELQFFISNLASPKKNDELVDRKDAAQLLGISLPTLNTWTKKGIIPGYRIASRVRYKQSELYEAVKKIKTGNKGGNKS